MRRALAVRTSLLVAPLLVGCTPISSFRPASALVDGHTGEVGIGGSLVAPRPFVDEETRAAGQLWLSRRVAKDLTLTGVGAVEREAFAIGGAARIDVLRTRRLVVAPEVQLGLLFAGADAGLALRLWDQTWLYAAPYVGNRGSTWAFEMAAGSSARIYEGFVLRAEYRVSWAGELSYYQQRRMFGVALVRQF